MFSMFNFFKKKEPKEQEEQTNKISENQEFDNFLEKEIHENQENSFLNGEEVIEAKHWYKDQYKRTVIVSGIMSMTLLFSISLNIILLNNAPSPRYFMQNKEGKLIDMIPFNIPYVSKEGVINWTADVVVRTLGFSFLDWRKSFMDIKDQFTDNAFEQFFGSLKEKGFIDKVIQERLITSVIVSSPPVITAKGLYEGVYSWRLEFPVTMSFEASHGTINTQKFNVTALIMRANTLIHPKGIVIKQLLLERG